MTRRVGGGGHEQFCALRPRRFRWSVARDDAGVADDPALMALFTAIEAEYDGFSPIRVIRVTSGLDEGDSTWMMIVYTHAEVRDGEQRLGWGTYGPRGDLSQWADTEWDRLLDRPAYLLRLPDDPLEIVWNDFALGWDVNIGPPPPPPRGEPIVDFAAVVAEGLVELSAQPHATGAAIELVTVGRTARPGVNWIVVIYRAGGHDGTQRVGWGGYLSDTDRWTRDLDRVVTDLWWDTIVEPPGADLPAENINPLGVSWWRGREGWTVESGPPADGRPAAWEFLPAARKVELPSVETPEVPAVEETYFDPFLEGVAAWRRLPDGHRDLVLARFDAEFAFRDQPCRKGPRITEPAPSCTFDLQGLDRRGFDGDEVNGPLRLAAARAAISAEALRCILSALPGVRRMITVHGGWERDCVELRVRTQAHDRARWLFPIYPHQSWSALLTSDMQHGVFADSGQRTLCVIGEPLLATLARSLETWLPTIRVDGRATNLQ